MSGGVEPETPPSSGGSASGSPMARKPPRHQLTAIRHCASSARIAAASTDLVTTLTIPSSSLPGHFLKLLCVSLLFSCRAWILGHWAWSHPQTSAPASCRSSGLGAAPISGQSPTWRTSMFASTASLSTSECVLLLSLHQAPSMGWVRFLLFLSH